MTYSSNLEAINTNATNPQFDPDKYFNNFALPPINVSQNTNDAIQSFFENITKNKKSATILASSVIFTATSQRIEPMVALAQFQKVPPGQINEYLAMFLNLNRVGTSLLGLNNKPRANQFVQRSIIV
jgi:hypothetical protein